MICVKLKGSVLRGSMVLESYSGKLRDTMDGAVMDKYKYIIS